MCTYYSFKASNFFECFLCSHHLALAIFSWVFFSAVWFKVVCFSCVLLCICLILESLCLWSLDPFPFIFFVVLFWVAQSLAARPACVSMLAHSLVPSGSIWGRNKGRMEEPVTITAGHRHMDCSSAIQAIAGIAHRSLHDFVPSNFVYLFWAYLDAWLVSPAVIHV